MYTGSLGEAAKGREAELLAAADKYSLLELKKQCEKVSFFIMFISHRTVRIWTKFHIFFNG